MYMDDTQELEIEEYKQLKTQDIASNLGIAESTVRKYCQHLAEKGYDFRRDETGSRIYTDHDQVALLELMKLRKEGKVGLDVSAEIVATRRKNRRGTANGKVSPTQNVQPAENKDFQNHQQVVVMQNITELMHDIRHIKENVVSKEQVNYLVQSVEKVLDSNTELLHKLNESEKQKEKVQKENQILKEKIDTSVEVTQKIYEMLDEDRNKGFLAKLFGKQKE